MGDRVSAAALAVGEVCARLHAVEIFIRSVVHVTRRSSGRTRGQRARFEAPLALAPPTDQETPS